MTPTLLNTRVAVDAVVHPGDAVVHPGFTGDSTKRSPCRLIAVARETGHHCSRRVRSIVLDEAGMVREQTVRSSSLQCRLLLVL